MVLIKKTFCAACAASTLAVAAELPENTLRQLDDAHAVRAELGRVVEQLEAEGKGQYARMSYEVISSCLDGMEREDLPHGYTNRVVREARQLARIARPALERARRELAGVEPSRLVPRFQSGAPVRSAGALLVSDRVWPDGRVEKDVPVIFNGWGHFSRVRREMPQLNRMGYNFIQIEEGIYKFMPDKGVVRTNAVEAVRAVAAAAWSNDTRVAYLLSPHYVPAWIYRELPKDNGACRNGFMPLCIHDPHVNQIFADYCGLATGLAKDIPGIHSFTLSNEPHGGDVSQCRSMKKLWVRYLQGRYGSIAELNAKWGTKYGAFEEVGMAAYPNLEATPACLEFIRCTRQATSDFHAGLVAAAKKAAPHVPVHSKVVVNECFMGRRLETFWSIDPVWFAENMDYLDHDSIAFPMDGPRSRYAARWVENEAAYDYLRSFAVKPVINTENHNIVDKNYAAIPPEHVYAALWQNVIHGQTATAFWCWERGLNDASIMIGLAPEQPDCLEAMGRCSLDVQRLSKELAPIMAERPTVLVMHSLATEVLGGRCDGADFREAYAAASFLGEAVGVATDETLARFARDGVRRAPYDTARAIILPNVTHLPAETLSGLRRLEREGVRVIAFGKVPSFDDFGRPLTETTWTSAGNCEELVLHRVLARSAKAWQSAARPRACVPGTATPVFGVETHGYVTEKGVRRLTLCNQLRQSVTVDVGSEGRDLITGRRTGRILSVASRVPLFIELDAAPAAAADKASFVDVFTGTAATGHTHPGACVPFGMVQVGPDTGTGEWKYCSGYQYADASVLGYSLTHLSGTGCPDLGDVRILPFTGEAAVAGRPPYRGGDGRARSPHELLRRPIDKASEKGEPGYYSVLQPDDGVAVELTAATRAAMMRFAWRKPGTRRVMVDLSSAITQPWCRAATTNAEVRLEASDTLIGHFRRDGWVANRTVGFSVRFSRDWSSVERLDTGKDAAPRFVFTFADLPDDVLLVEVGYSALSGESARANAVCELPGCDFDATRLRSRKAWNALLGRFDAQGSPEQLTNFYTCVYHLFQQPNVWSDSTGKTTGADGNYLDTWPYGAYYTTLSIWDTFRAAQPLYTLVAPEVAFASVDSLLMHAHGCGRLPTMSYGGRNVDCMIANHAVSLVVDAYFKGHRRNDASYWNEMLEVVKNTLTEAHAGKPKEDWTIYDRYGYFPFDLIRGESVSRTFECCFDDWCAARLFAAVGRKTDADFFAHRAQNWKNVFDARTGFARGKDTKGRWREPFDPYLYGHGADTPNDFTEGNAFQYTWHVMQDPEGLIAAMGGREAFEKKLDALFEQPHTTEGEGELCDISGLIGQYVHGNEPSHHVLYFYPLIGRPEKAARRIREVFDKFYHPGPDGLCGNDDCGQMSAWYLFSAMGFYPFNPCNGEYVIGAPQLPRIEMKVKGSDGKPRTFVVTAKNLSKANRFVKSVTLNGKPIADWKIRHEDILKGGELVFEMTSR